MALIRCIRARTDRHYCYFEATFDANPTTKEIRDAQTAEGYHPGGYGGPNNVKVHQCEDKTFMTTWSCSNNCD